MILNQPSTVKEIVNLSSLFGPYEMSSAGIPPYSLSIGKSKTFIKNTTLLPPVSGVFNFHGGAVVWLVNLMIRISTFKDIS